MEASLQEEFGPETICFGCGPANTQGLRIRSVVRGDTVVCDWDPSDHHEAFPGVLNGGIIGTLLDCHMNWTAAWHLMQASGAHKPPVTVTSEFHVFLKRPTPSKQPLRLVARVVESQPPRAVIESTLESGGKVTAVGKGTFVAVQEGHPAWHRW
jgi:acyl-coenzyme A thioesterase PaaI-like protein